MNRVKIHKSLDSSQVFTFLYTHTSLIFIYLFNVFLISTGYLSYLSPQSSKIEMLH